MISLRTFGRQAALGLTLLNVAVLDAAQSKENLVAGEIWATDIVGRVSVTTAGGEERPIGIGPTLSQGATLRTEPGARAVFAFVDGTTVKVSEDSEWSVEEFAVDAATPPPPEPRMVRSAKAGPPAAERVRSRTKLRFERGEIELHVAPLDLQRGARFLVETPAGVVSIRGTTFRLRLRPVGDDANEFSVSVTEGMVVFFTKDGKTVEYVSPNRPYVVKIPR